MKFDISISDGDSRSHSEARAIAEEALSEWEDSAEGRKVAEGLCVFGNEAVDRFVDWMAERAVEQSYKWNKLISDNSKNSTLSISITVHG